MSLIEFQQLSSVYSIVTKIFLHSKLSQNGKWSNGEEIVGTLKEKQWWLVFFQDIQLIMQGQIN